jgi:hypothetical protein
LRPLQIRASPDEYIELSALVSFDLSLELVNQVLGRSEFAGLDVSARLGLDDPQQQRFKLFQVLIADREIDAESVPMWGEPVF